MEFDELTGKQISYGGEPTAGKPYTTTSPTISKVTSDGYGSNDYPQYPVVEGYPKDYSIYEDIEIYAPGDVREYIRVNMSSNPNEYNWVWCYRDIQYNYDNETGEQTCTGVGLIPCIDINTSEPSSLGLESTYDVLRFPNGANDYYGDTNAYGADRYYQQNVMYNNYPPITINTKNRDNHVEQTTIVEKTDYTYGYTEVLNASELARQIITMAEDYLNDGTVSGSTNLNYGDNSESKAKYENAIMEGYVNEKGYKCQAYEAKIREEFGDFLYERAYASIVGDTTNNGNHHTVGSETKYWLSIFNVLKDRGAYYDAEANNTFSFATKLDNEEYHVDSLTLAQTYVSVVDTETRSKAEKFYKTEMDDLHKKEKEMDEEMTKLQTEFAALQADYNSVKAIVTNNVNRIFTYSNKG